MTTTVVPTTLSREYRFTQTASDGLTLEGYAAVFDSPTRIANAWEGDFTETIARGAFARAVRQNPKPKVQFDHGQHPLLGSIPIAALTSMREDEKGLFISARIHDNWLTEPVRDAIKSGAIDGMSFRFAVPPGGDEWSTDRSTRTLKDVDVFEFGPVVFPAYAGATVSVRSQQLADALKDDAVRHDLAVALLLDNLTDLPTPTDDDTAPLEVAVSDEVEVRDDDVIADQTPVSSAPNPARTQATLYAVRAALAAQRSTHYEPSGLFDD